MAKLSGPLSFEGKLQDFSAYKMKGVDGIVLRMGWGPSKEDIKTKGNYVNTRRINAEFGGRSTTASYIKRILKPIETSLDYNMMATLTGLLKQMQAEDAESEWGLRNVLISSKPFLLEGLTLNRRYPFDTVVSTPIKVELDKEAGKALVNIPQLIPSVNFFPPANFSVCRIRAILGFVPDFHFAEPRYKPLLDVKQWQPALASTEWFQAGNGCPPSEMSLSITGTLPPESYSLMVAVGVQVGTPLPGHVLPLKRNGCGKILVVR
jgi:hypothetical protein